MKLSIAALLTLLPAVLATPLASTGSYSIEAFTSPQCSTSSTVFETLTGSTTSSCVAFPGGQSVEVVLEGSCTSVTFFDGANCIADSGSGPDQTDVGPFPPGIGCQTFALNGQSASFNSFKVFC